MKTTLVLDYLAFHFYFTGFVSMVMLKSSQIGVTPLFSYLSCSNGKETTKMDNS